MVDNSLSDLSFDFLGTFAPAKDEKPVCEKEPEAPASPEVVVAAEAVPATAAPAAPAAAQPADTVVLAQGERLVRVVSAPRRHAWGALYVLRTILILLAVFCVGSLVLTMILNPDLTFGGAMSLLIERVGSVAERIRGMFA